MYLTFAWRYFRAKKSANAINIIAWLSVFIIAVATGAQVLVLSVFNGFEDLVKSLYASFYTDVRIVPANGKTILLSSTQINAIKKLPNIGGICMIAEEKALIKNEDAQKAITLKGVDDNYKNVTDINSKIINGSFKTGDIDNPLLVVGLGVQNNTYISVNDAMPSSNVTIILPKRTTSINIDEAISEGNVLSSGVFAIQQEIDDKFAITNIDFVKQQMGFGTDEYSAVEIKLINKKETDATKNTIKNLLGKSFMVQTRYEQNANLYSTMQLEKWAVYLVLTLIIIIASFNIISVLTMLVLEKQKDIIILRSMGTTKWGIQKIFLAEGLLLGVIGAVTGIGLALIICFLQIKFHFIKLSGGSFLIDYFPVKLLVTDFLLIAITIIIISLLAAWFPASKASNKIIELK